MVLPQKPEKREETREQALTGKKAEGVKVRRPGRDVPVSLLGGGR